MSDMSMENTGGGEHAWAHENLAAYLASGLSADERVRLDAHVNACAECFDAFTEARDADRVAQRALAGLLPAGEGAAFEDRIITHTRETTMSRWKHPMIRRAAYATAAAVALAATGVFANIAMHQNGRFSNPLSQELAANAEKSDAKFGNPLALFDKKDRSSEANSTVTDLRGVSQSMAVIGESDQAQNGDGTTRKMFYTLDDAQAAAAKARSDVKADVLATMPAEVRKAKIAELMTDARKLYDASEFRESADILRQAVVADPHNTEAEFALRMTLDKITDRQYSEIERRSGQEVMRQNIDSAEHLIPYADLMVSADNWPEITRARVSGNAVTPSTQAGQSLAFGDDHADFQRSSNFGANKGVANDGLLDINRSGLLTTSGPVSGAGTITHSGAGTTTLLGAYTANGPVNVNNGTLRGAGGEPGVSGNVSGSPTAGTSFGVGGIGAGYLPFEQVAKKTAASDWAYAADIGQDGRFGANISGAGTITHGGNGTAGLTKAGVGTVTLTGGNTFYGGASVASGSTVQAGGVATTDGPAMNFNGGNLSSVNGKMLTAKSDFDNGKTEVANAPTINLNGGTLSADKYQLGVSTNSGLFNQSVPGSSGAPGSVSIAGEDAEKTGKDSDHFMTNQVDLAKLEPNNPANQRAGGGQVVSRGDALDVSVFELVTPGQDYQKQSKVDAQGNIHIDNIGDIYVEGLTPRQIEERISQVATEKGMLLGKGNGSPAPEASVKLADGNQAKKPATGNLPAIGRDFVRVADADKAGETGKFDNSMLALEQAGGQESGQGTPATRPVQTPPQAIAQLKIIRNGTIEFEVRSFDDTYLTVARIVGDDGGFVSSTSSEKLANGHVRGMIVVRVPPERLERFLLELRSLGDLKAQQIAANDVTKQYTDTESELRGLRTMETRLLDLIKNGKGEVKDLVEAEKQLGEYRVRIETLEGQLSYYNNLVSLATISITAYEKDIAKPTAASEQENVNLSVETEEVESQYLAARKTLDDAKARIVESQLRNTDAEHVAAHIVADVPPDKADFVAGQLKTLGKVASFNRDRRQTTTGGTGAPSVEVEHKDTRITIELFNLANLAPRETTVIRVAVPNVETTYSEILAKMRAAAAPEGPEDKAPKTAGRVISSNLSGQLPEQMTADINAQIRSENTDELLAAIKKSGEVLTSSLATNSDNASTTGAKRGIQLTLVNIAAIPPKEIHSLNIAVRDVDKAYRDLLAVVNKELSKEDAAVNPLLPATVGRVVSSGVNGQQPEQMTADVRAQIRTEKMADVLAALQGGAGYEVMSNSVSQSPEAINFTRAKQGLEVRFINVATIAARETRVERLVAVNVEESYKKLQESLSAMAAKGDVRIIASNLDQSDARNVLGNFRFEVRREALAQIDKAFADAGIDFLTGSTSRSSDANTLDSKVYFQIDELRSTDTLAPRRTIAIRLEVPDVDKAVDELRTQIRKTLPGPAAGETAVREIEFTVQRDKPGSGGAHIVYDVPQKDSFTLQAAIDKLGGVEKNNQISKNSAVPDKPFARERFDLVLVSAPASSILPPDKGIGQSARAALSSASGALVLSLYYVLTGLLFILPFALILWPIWAIIKRKRAAAA